MPSGFTAEQLAAVVRAAGEAIVVMRPDETVAYANNAAAAIFGAPSGEALVGQSLDRALGGFDLLDEDGQFLAPEKHTVPRVLGGERQSRAIERLRPKSGGSDRWTAVTSTAMTGADGKVEYVVTVLRDVTGQKRAEASLAFLSRASAVLGSSLDDGAVLAQLALLCVPEVADGCAVFLVPQGGTSRRLAVTSLEPRNPDLARRLSNLLATRSEGTVLDEVVASGQSLLVSETAPVLPARVAASGHAAAVVRALRLRSLMIVPIAGHGVARGVLVLAMAQSRRHFDATDLALAEDVAHRAALAIEHARVYAASHAAEIRLAAQAEQLATTVRVRDEFLSIASHELKTPLTSLQLNLDMLAKATVDQGPRDDGEIAALMEGARRQYRRLVRLANELLDVSRIESGRLRLEHERLDLAALARDVASRFAPEVEALGGTLSVRASTCVTGEWDRLRIEQVLAHLLSNAVRFGRRGPIDLEVSCCDRLARVHVQDAGIGIEPDACDRIFGRFERAVSSRNYGGLGLGLYITRQIVLAHGGTIVVASRPGEGSRFTVELPLRPAALAVKAD